MIRIMRTRTLAALEQRADEAEQDAAGTRATLGENVARLTARITELTGEVNELVEEIELTELHQALQEVPQ